MRVLLFLLDVNMLRELEGARVTAMLVWGTEEVWLGRVQGMSMWVVHVVSCIVSNAADVLGVRVVRGMKGVGGVCEMCMSLVRGGVEGDWIRGFVLGFTNPVDAEGVLDVCLYLGCGGVCGVGNVGEEWV